MSHDAVLMRVNDGDGEKVVVDHADDEIWIARELWRLITDPTRESRINGDFEVTTTDKGDVLLAFGTPGEGLGRLRYRLVQQGERYMVCERVREESKLRVPSPFRNIKL